MDKLLHISHFDTDGKTPLCITSTIAGAYPFEVTKTMVHPASLLELLMELDKNDDRGKYDIILITDLNIKQDILEYLWMGGWMRNTCIIDHHKINYEPIEFVTNLMMNEQLKNAVVSEYGEEYLNLDLSKHIYIQDTLNEKPTSATELYTTLIRNGAFDAVFNIENDTAFEQIRTYYTDGEFTQTDVKIGIEKLKYLGQVVACWDTYSWTDNEENYISQDAIRLNALCSLLSFEEYEAYIHFYLTNPDIDWQKLTFGYGEYSYIGKIIDVKIDMDKRYIDTVANTMVSVAWEPTNIIVGDDGEKVMKSYGEVLEVGVVYTTYCTSSTAKVLYEKYPNLDCIAIVNVHSVSLYSNKNGGRADMHLIAGLMGGGGHPHAAGFPVDDGDAAWMNRNHFIGLMNLKSGKCKVTQEKDENGNIITKEHYGV